MFKEQEIVQRLCEKLGVPALEEVLSKAAWRDVQPILIMAMRDRVKRKKAENLLSEHKEKNEFYGVSGTDQRTFHEFLGHFYSVVPANFQVPELSPITPMGLNAVLTNVSQDVSLSSIRVSEVVSDPTTPLALHCAKLRKDMLPDSTRRGESVRLATMHRVVRLQPFDASKGYMQHFRLLGLCSGGRDRGHASFYTEHLIEHVSIWLNFVEHLMFAGFKFRELEVKISDVRVAEALIKHHHIDRGVINLHSLDEDYDFFAANGISFPRERSTMDDVPEDLFTKNGLQPLKSALKSAEDRLLVPLKKAFPSVRFSFDFARKAGLGYYQHLCYHIFAKTETGRRVQLADGGTVDWLAKLLASRKECMVTSGFGCELVQNKFSPTTDNPGR